MVSIFVTPRVIGMFVWTLGKFVNYIRSSKIFCCFYGFEGVDKYIIYLFGILKLLLVLFF
jgi:hypothetical protein